MNTTVKVALRVRPLTSNEQLNNCSESIAYVPNEPQINIVGSDKSFTFDYIFDDTTKQREVYEKCAKELVERFTEGFNATILAYGQTGSGKTYSMGTGHQYQQGDEAIVPRAAHAIFSQLTDHQEKDPAMEFQVYVSFLELYNEELIDLLQTPRTRKDTIQVREDGLGGISWHGVKEQQVTSAKDIMDWLHKGSMARTTAATDMNQTSSRSHAIFSVILKQQRSEEAEAPAEGEETEEAAAKDRPLRKFSSKFHFVDLAGSERLKRTRAVGDRAKEGISINAGLLALGNVISALGDESRRSSFIPYRDSKLTRLLQDSLGGNSTTLMVACISPSDSDINETVSTLVYANRARNIRNRVVINQDFDGVGGAEVAKLRAEINRLKMENQAFKAMGAGPTTELNQRRAAEEIKSLRGEVTRLRERLKENSDELCDVLAERDTLLVERDVAGDANIEAHPIMVTYHRNVIQLKERLIAAEDQALELQQLLTQKPAAVFGRRPGTSPKRKVSPIRKKFDPITDDDHDADGEHEERKDGSPARGRQPKRKSRQSSRAVSRFDFGAHTVSGLTAAEPAKLPTSPPLAQVDLSAGGASSWFSNLKAEENQPLRRAARAGTGDNVDKAKEDIRRGLLLLKAEKNGVGMDMDLFSLLDPGATAAVKMTPASSRRRDSMTSSMSSGSSRSRFQIMPTLEDVANGNAISPMRSSSSFSFPLPPGQTSWKETQSPQDQKVFFEAEQKAQETLANAMKAMHRFSFPLSSSDTMSISQQQSRIAAAIQLQKAAGVPLPDSDAGSAHDTASVVGSISARSSHRSSRFPPTAPSVDFSVTRSSSSRHEGSFAGSRRRSSALFEKDELVVKLAQAEADLMNLEQHYEEEIQMMKERIREAEMDRERDNKIPGSAKVKYEAKIKQLMTQLSDLEHKFNEVSKVANEKRSVNESQLRSLRNAVETLKTEKQRMLKRMKEDAERIKEINATNDREIQLLRRAEKAASDARKKAENELVQQQRNATMHRTNNSSANTQAKVTGLLKKPQAPKGISKAPRRTPRLGSPDRSNDRDTAASSRGKSRQSATRQHVNVTQKKLVIDRAIYAYISGQQTINVMDDLLKKRQRLNSEKLELEQERERVVRDTALKEERDEAEVAQETQYMDDRLTMIEAEGAYINARIRALQAEAAALGVLTTIEKANKEDGKDGSAANEEEEELIIKLIRQGMAEDSMALPPGSGPLDSFESAIGILRSLNGDEAREFSEMLFEDMVSVRTNENALSVQAAHQEKVIDELKQALQSMRQAAVGATLGYEKRCDGLEQQLRQLGGSPAMTPAPGPHTDGSSEDDEHDAEVAGIFRGDNAGSSSLSRKDSKDSLLTPLPENRSGSASDAVLDGKAKRASAIFDQLYEDAMKTSDVGTPKIGGELSRLMMSDKRRVSFVMGSEMPTLMEHESEQMHNPQPQPQQAQSGRPRLVRSNSATTGSTLQRKPSVSDLRSKTPSTHRRSGSTSAGSGNSQVLPGGRPNNMSRPSMDSLKGRRSSTPSVGAPPLPLKSRNRNSGVPSTNTDQPLPSPAQHHRGAPPPPINTGFATGHQPTLRHAKSQQLNSNRMSLDNRRSSTPTPGSGQPAKRLLRSDSDGTGMGRQTRPPSRVAMPSPGLHGAFDAEHNNRRVSGHFDEGHSGGMSIFERLASGHTQSSHARAVATRNATHPTLASAPAGGSMMTSGNMNSHGFQQIQQQQLQARGRPSSGEQSEGHEQWGNQSESSVTSSLEDPSPAMHEEAVSVF
ncbi:hypothetical protein BGX31_006864 [Mortierella sp. GBA43]|nr:hypothetical protein BGX31_006864 [Mortierella sp. GBA43]